MTVEMDKHRYDKAKHGKEMETGIKKERGITAPLSLLFFPLILPAVTFLRSGKG